MPVWSLILAIGLTVIYILPGGFIYAMTAQLVCVSGFFADTD